MCEVKYQLNQGDYPQPVIHKRKPSMSQHDPQHDKNGVVTSQVYNPHSSVTTQTSIEKQNQPVICENGNLVTKEWYDAKMKEARVKNEHSIRTLQMELEAAQREVQMLQQENKEVEIRRSAEIVSKD